MKKCKGCGIELQNVDNKKIGFVPDLEQDYCQRCFRLSHYGDITNLNNKNITNKGIMDIYSQYAKDTFVVIVDAFEALVINQDEFFDLFDKNRFILIINKTDLLPKNISDDKVDTIYEDVINRFAGNHHNLISCILTHKKDSSFNDVFYETLNSLKCKRLVFAGRANVGKSSLINKLINNNELTTSLYPGTTLRAVEIKHEGYTFIDTPGYIDENNVSSYLPVEIFKDVMIEDTIKPQVFQLYEKQTYFYEDLLRIDVEPKDKASVVFYLNNNLLVHRTKTFNVENYLKNKRFKYSLKPKSANEFTVKKKSSFYIKGLGFFTVNSDCLIRIHVFDKIKIYKSEVNL